MNVSTWMWRHDVPTQILSSNPVALLTGMSDLLTHSGGQKTL